MTCAITTTLHDDNGPAALSERPGADVYFDTAATTRPYGMFRPDALGSLALLTAEEERELARLVARGDEAAKARLVRANLRLVVKIARAFEGRGIDTDDLIGEGNLGLIRAAERYDPEFGTRFGTYAGYWIKESIRRALLNTGAVIRLPAHMSTLLRKWKRCERGLARSLGRAPLRDEVAEELGLTPVQRDMADRAELSTHLRLVDWAGDAGSHTRDGGDSTPVSSDAPEAALETEEERQGLRARLDRLDPRERQVIISRFGLDGNDPLTLSELGRRLGVTRETVRKIEARAVQKLR